MTFQFTYRRAFRKAGKDLTELAGLPYLAKRVVASPAYLITADVFQCLRGIKKKHQRLFDPSYT